MADPAVKPPDSPITTRPTRVRHWVVVFAVALAVITYIDRVAISFAAPAISQDLGLSTVQMGWVLSAFAWAYALFEIPGGFLGDWIGPRKVLVRIVLWWSFFTAATGWAWSLASMTITRFLFGAGEAGCFPNLTKVFSVWLPPREKVRAQGLLWMSARWGGAFTPPLVNVVMGRVGWRHAFEFFGIIGLAWAAVFFLWFRDNPKDHRGLNDAERDLLRGNSALGSGHSDVPWRKFLTSGRVWLLCWQYFFSTYGWYFYITWLPTYLREGRHVAIASSALLGILPLFLGGLGNYAGVFFAERVQRFTHSLSMTRRFVACFAYAGACVCLVFSTFVSNPLLAMMTVGLSSFCGDLAMPMSWGSTMDLGGKYAGTISGAMNMWGNMGGALSPLVIGYLLASTGNNWNLTFYISGAVYTLAILCWLFLDSETPLEGAM